MAIGDITEAIIDTLSLDAAGGNWPKQLQISDSVHVVVYRSAAGTGVVKTYSCATGGSLADIDNYQFAASAACPFICRIGSTTNYVIITTTHLYTLTISDAGAITPAIIDTILITDVRWQGGGNYPKICRVASSDIYVACWDGDGSPNTFQISDAGIMTYKDFLGITAAFWNLTPAEGNWVAAVGMQGTFIVAWAFEVNTTTGDFTDWPSLALHTPASYSQSSMTRIDTPGGAGTSYYVGIWRIMSGPGQGHLYGKSFSITNVGGLAIIDVHEPEGLEDNNYPHAQSLSVTNSMVGYVWQGTGNDGWLATWEIDSTGNITGLYDEWEFDATGAITPNLLNRADANVVMIAYRDGSGVLKIITVAVDMGAIAPTVTTDAASGISAAAATLNGTLDDDGGEACDCGFEWGKTETYSETTPTQSKTIGESFSQALTGLSPSTTYHFRAFAINSAGTAYGADRTFATSLVISRGYALAREEL